MSDPWTNVSYPKAPAVSKPQFRDVRQVCCDCGSAFFVHYLVTRERPVPEAKLVRCAPCAVKLWQNS